MYSTVNWVIIGSANSLYPMRRPAGSWTNNHLWSKNKLQWNMNQSTNIFVKEIGIENVVCARLFRRRSKKTSKFCVTGHSPGNLTVSDEFPSEMASNAENVSICWRHHGQDMLNVLTRVMSFAHQVYFGGNQPLKIKKSKWYIMTSSNGIISALLALCAGNSPVTDEFPSQRPVTRDFDVFFDLSLNKPLSKWLWGWWFETPSRSLWHHCNEHTFSKRHSHYSLSDMTSYHSKNLVKFIIEVIRTSTITNSSGILVMSLSTWARFSAILMIYRGLQAAC